MRPVKAHRVEVLARDMEVQAQLQPILVTEAGHPLYRLVCKPHLAPRLTRTGKPVTQAAGVENMWRSMRMLAEFTARDIAAHTTTDLVGVTEMTAKSDCSLLFRAGYLRVTRKAVPGRAIATYRLIRISGPRGACPEGG